MKYILATNSKHTRTSATNPVVPATFGSPTNFKVNFNRTIELPAFCQVCIVSSTVNDANNPKIHYVECPDLPLKTTLGNLEKGGSPPILGAIVSDANVYGVKNWVDLDNPSPLVITGLSIRIVNQDGFESSGLTGASEILIGYRAKGNTQQVS